MTLIDWLFPHVALHRAEEALACIKAERAVLCGRVAALRCTQKLLAELYKLRRGPWRSIESELFHRHSALARAKFAGQLSKAGEAELEVVRAALDGIEAAHRRPVGEFDKGVDLFE